MKRKILSLLITVGLVTGLMITGCSSDKSDKKNAAETKESASQNNDD